MTELWKRLRQRKLAQWGLAYLAGAWVMLQVLEMAAGSYDWPALVMRLAFALVALGFLATLVLAWYHGERGEQKVSGMEILLLAALLAVGGGLIWRSSGAGEEGAAQPGRDGAVAAVENPVAAAAPHPKSVAVLPFASMSRGEDDAYFADGLSEETINALARVPDLRVAARTSSFAFRGSGKTVPQIAAELQVATILEGSVRRAGEQLRMTVQLVRASDGFQLWAENYDRDSRDIIDIQEDVARSIAQSLQTVADPEALADMQRAGTRSVPAYQSYLRGLALMQKGNYQDTSRTDALVAFNEATRLDPGFSDAYARAADLEWDMLRPSGFSAQEASQFDYADGLRRFHDDLDRAATHARNPVQRGYYDALRASANQQFVEALRLMREYSLAYPNDPAAHTYIGEWALYLGDYAAARRAMQTLSDLPSSLPTAGTVISVLVWAGDADGAVRQSRRSLGTGSPTTDLVYQAHRAFLSAGEVEEAARLMPRLLSSDLGPLSKHVVQARQACAEGRSADAQRILAEMVATDSTSTPERWHVLHLLGREQDASQLLAYMDAPEYLNALSSFLIYAYFDVSRYPNLEEILLDQGIRRPPPRRESYACPRDVPLA